jgi:DNA helicase II / ATP-dependent DNA helicase PcrA
VFDYLKELNEAQRRAVLNTEGPSLVIAGAGSGKTRVLTYRIAHLLKKGVRPSSILALTFTNKAAREMKERISGVVGENVSRYLWMGTFHSIFARILRAEHEVTGFPHNFTILDTADSKSLIKSIIKSFKLDDKIYKPGIVASRISMAKNNLITPAVYAENSEIRMIDRNMKMPSISDIYREYVKRCYLSGAMDFDDLLLMTNILFRDHQEILAKYQDRFGYILVDEYQDTNYAQYLIVKKLAGRHRNICVVGDDAQSIYSFRGARIENILSFQNDYPKYQIFKLEQNYRSTQTIVNAANSIISKNKIQIPKRVFSEKEEGKAIKVISALTDNEEGFIVAREIAETQSKNNYRYVDYAILYRTNAQSRIFEEALRKRNIPYKIYGGLSFYQRKEIRDLLAYFRLAINNMDNEALKRIINYPGRGIGQTTLVKLESAASDADATIWKIIKDLPENNISKFNNGTILKLLKFSSLIEELSVIAAENDAYEAAVNITEQSGILKELKNDTSSEGISRFDNVQELLNGLREFSSNAREEDSQGKLENFMEEVALLTDQDDEKDEDRDKVTLMTIHSAKGLEFKNVFVVGLEENLFPSSQVGEQRSPEAMEEERRLFYVALTRAMENAWFTWATQRYRWGKLDFCSPSRFLLEMDGKYLEEIDSDNDSDKSGYEPTRFEKPGDWFSRNSAGYSPAAQKTGRENPGKLLPVDKYLSERSKDNDFKGDDPEKIIEGMTVEHQRFGKGKVLKVENYGSERKAIVLFINAGQKQLLLKFARLRIIE